MSSKIDKPPYVHNWVRLNHPDQISTTKSVVSFLINTPQVSYLAGQQIIRDRIFLKLDRATARKAAATKGHEKSRPYVTDYVDAFYDYDEVRNYSGMPSYDQFVAPYSISRDLRVPVQPLVIISEGGVLKPIFVVGWAKMPLSLFQRRLLMTIIEDAVFSLTDFQQSPGEFVSFPRSSDGSRHPEVWQRGDFQLLSDAELRDQFDVYVRSVVEAKLIVAKRQAPRSEAPEQRAQPTMDDLFKEP